MPEVELWEVPRGNLRHRTANGHQYTPAATLEARRQIRLAWLESGFGKVADRDGAVTLEVWAFLPRPRVHFGTGRNAERLKPAAPRVPVTKPDFDNLAKLVADALAGVAFHDDAGVADGIVHKRYAGGPGEPVRAGWRIRVEPWKEA